MAVALGALAGFPPTPASAHPHVFVSAETTLVVNDAGALSSIEYVWRFDQPFRADLVQRLDKDQDGKLSAAELEGVADTVTGRLAASNYMTVVRPAGPDRFLSFTFVPRNASIADDAEGLTLRFALDLSVPAPATEPLQILLYDRGYYTDVTLSGAPAVRAPAAFFCSTAVAPRPEPDAETKRYLASLDSPLLSSLYRGRNVGGLIDAMASEATLACS